MAQCRLRWVSCLSHLCVSIVRILPGLPPPSAKFSRLTTSRDGTLASIQASLQQLGSPDGGIPRVAIGNERVRAFSRFWGKVAC